uniref:Uncharacterized protein n=1 Tax=Setaria digitata TaxID=48799 RepID=A0A915Q2H7_9BILA
MLLQVAALAIIVLNVKVSGDCVDQLQQCAILTEEYERLILETRHSAFRTCFAKQIYELALFERCFERSVRAVRVSLSKKIVESDNFVHSAHRYLSALKNCFDSSQGRKQFPDFKSILIDEDAIYARTIYSIEYADHLWGLPQLISTYAYLENSVTLSCLIREKTGRVFGNGINRFIDSADLKLNNVSGSCFLEENEMQCYRLRLSNDRFYQELLIDRDRVIRSCIRSVRLQTQCHPTDASRLRACLCSAREEFENRVQVSILQCVRQSHADYVHRTGIQQLQHHHHQRQNKNFDKLVPATGTVWNNQCLCACPNHVNFANLTMLKHRVQKDVINDQQDTRRRQAIYADVQGKLMRITAVKCTEPGCTENDE